MRTVFVVLMAVLCAPAALADSATFTINHGVDQANVGSTLITHCSGPASVGGQVIGTATLLLLQAFLPPDLQVWHDVAEVNFTGGGSYLIVAEYAGVSYSAVVLEKSSGTVVLTGSFDWSWSANSTEFTFSW